jgi:hypothetical protein
VTALQTPMRLASGRTISYALGLENLDYDGVREVSHSGSTAGYRTFLARYPDQHVSVAVWCNYAGANPTQLAHRVVDLVLTKPGRVAAQAAPRATLTAEQLSRWAGIYRDAHTDQAMALVARDGALATQRGRAAVSFEPEAADRFRSTQGDAAFSGAPGRRRFTLARPDGDTAVFEEVAPPGSPIRVGDYTGTYRSDELDVKLVVAERDGKLVLRRRPADELELRPVYADDFSAPTIGTIRFARNAAGVVTGFSIYGGRVLDVRFERAR